MQEHTLASFIGELIGYYLLFRFLWRLARRTLFKPGQDKTGKTEQQGNKAVQPSGNLTAWLNTMYKRTDGQHFPEFYITDSDRPYLEQAIAIGKIEVLHDKSLGNLYRVLPR